MRVLQVQTHLPNRKPKNSSDSETAEKADKNDDIVDADFEVVDEADKKN